MIYTETVKNKVFFNALRVIFTNAFQGGLNFQESPSFSSTYKAVQP